jgi:hypothetical protein
MQQVFLDYWGAFVGLVGVIGVAIAWRQSRKGKTDTKNVAVSSNRVTQKGGSGTTVNEAKDSTDVDQSG